MAEKHISKVSEHAESGKGFARRARMNDQILAVVYDHGTNPVHVVLPYRDTFLLVKGNPNMVISLEGLKEPAMVLVKDIQRHPVKHSLMYLDLLLVKADEKINVKVPVVVVGELIVGTVTNLDSFHVEILAPVVDIPETIEVNVDGIRDGEALLVSEMKLFVGAKTVTDGETVVLSVAVPQEATVPGPSGEEVAGAKDTAATEGAGEAEQGGILDQSCTSRYKTSPKHEPCLGPSRMEDGKGAQLVVGLDNPGIGYVQTRHNCRYMVTGCSVESVGGKYHSRSLGRRGAMVKVVDARLEYGIGVPQVIVAHTGTYMNTSEPVMGQLLKFYQVDTAHLVTVHDDIDLSLRHAKPKVGGSNGGHNGLKSIQQTLGTKDFVRLRIRVGYPLSRELGGDVVSWVLGRLPKPERASPEESFGRVVQRINDVAESGLAKAQVRLYLDNP